MRITQGDQLTVRIRVRQGNDGPAIDLTGATFTSYFPADDGGVLEIPNEDHTIEDQTTNKGWVQIALSAEQSALLKVGELLSFTVKVEQASSIKHFHANKSLTVVSASPVEDQKPKSNIFIGAGL